MSKEFFGEESKNPKKWSCRWFDCLGEYCRNKKTHIDREKVEINGEVVEILVDPPCKYGCNCGYEKRDSTHPMWFSVSNEQKNNVGGIHDS